MIQIQHPKGTIISFEEDEHKYTDDKNRSYRSTTETIHSLFPEFERDEISFKCSQKKILKTEAYATVKDIPEEKVREVQKELLKEWDEKCEVACKLGNCLHRYAECILKNIPVDVEAFDMRSKKMVERLSEFLSVLLSQYEFVEAEKIIFAPDYLLAGTVDLIMKNKTTGKFCIFDWKTNKQIQTEDCYGKKGREFLEHLPDCNYWQYSLQLNVYRWMLLKEGYGDYDDVEMGLFHITTQDVKPYCVPRLDIETKQFMDYVKMLGEIKCANS
jgi:ATP-dependent exoDNAse (exonuclease V) beta subunit